MTQPVAKGEDGGEHVAGHKLGAGFQQHGEGCKDIVRENGVKWYQMCTDKKQKQRA